MATFGWNYLKTCTLQVDYELTNLPGHLLVP